MSHKNVYVGGTLCKNVYVGTQLVWTQPTQLRTFYRDYYTSNGGAKMLYLPISGMPIGLLNYPERVEEVRLSTGLVLPHVRAASSPADGIFALTLADTLANLGVPLNTTVTLVIYYRPE